MCGLEDPFSRSPCRLQEPHFSIFSVLKVLLSPQNHNLKKNFSSKASKLAKSSVPKPQKLGQTSVHKARAVASLTVPGGQEYHFPHFFHKIWIKFSYFSSNFSHFLPHFGPPGGQVREGPGYATAQGYILLRNSVHKCPKFGSDLFTSHSVWPFRLHTYT